MEIFGIGPLEFLLIVILMLIVLGPKDMVKTGQKLGRFIRKVIKSPAWASMMNTTREIRELPTRLVRESGLEDDLVEINKMRENLQFRDIPGKVIQELSIQEELDQIKKETTIDLPTPDQAPEITSSPSNESTQTGLADVEQNAEEDSTKSGE